MRNKKSNDYEEYESEFMSMLSELECVWYDQLRWTGAAHYRIEL